MGFTLPYPPLFIFHMGMMYSKLSKHLSHSRVLLSFGRCIVRLHIIYAHTTLATFFVNIYHECLGLQIFIPPCPTMSHHVPWVYRDGIYTKLYRW